MLQRLLQAEICNGYRYIFDMQKEISYLNCDILFLLLSVSDESLIWQLVHSILKKSIL